MLLAELSLLPLLTLGPVAPGTHDLFGDSLTRLPDVDRDGVNDFAVGAPIDGSVWIVSAAFGRPLARVRGVEPSDTFGGSLGTVGDCDGDGVADLLACWGSRGSDRTRGGVAVVSSSTGRHVLSLIGEGMGLQFGASACGIGDFDGDGRDDLVVGAADPDVLAGESRSVTTVARFLVVSGLDGKELGRWEGPPGVMHAAQFIATWAMWTVTVSSMWP